MAARAMWKGTLRLGDASVPVKLYAAAEDRRVRFRLLHATDKVPVEQRYVDADGHVVPREAVRRAWATADGEMVFVSDDELEALRPPPSRDIEVFAFVPPARLDHRWYARPYYLGPDGPAGGYAALAEALERTGRVGVARWVMRHTQYHGILRPSGRVLALVALRAAEQVVDAAALRPPGGAAPSAREVQLAGQLVGQLEGTFDPDAYRDEYQARVEQLVHARSRGVAVATPRARRRPRPEPDLAAALRASLKRARKSA